MSKTRAGIIPATAFAERTANDKKQGMTLDELAAFVEVAQAQRIKGSTIVRLTATWKSSIKKLRIEGEVTPDINGYHHLGTGD